MKKGKEQKAKSKSYKMGFTIIEMLVVLVIFSVVGILTARSVAVSFRNSRKSESMSKVRENIEDAMNVMERCLRNAGGINCVSGSRIEYEDEYGGLSFFECTGDPEDPGGTYIASQSATSRLTNKTIDVDCTAMFSCNNVAIPPWVDIKINAMADTEGVEGFIISSQTRVSLRTY